MTGGQTEEVAACSLYFTRKMLLPRCWKASLPLCLQLGPCLSMANSGPDSLRALTPRSRQDLHSVGRASQSCCGFVWQRDPIWELNQARACSAGLHPCRVPTQLCMAGVSAGSRTCSGC